MFKPPAIETTKDELIDLIKEINDKLYAQGGIDLLFLFECFPFKEQTRSQQIIESMFGFTASPLSSESLSIPEGTSHAQDH